MSKLINDTNFIRRPLYKQGKVRNVYEAGNNLLIIVTDRISAFDVIFPNLIPNKGKVLNSISKFWFDNTKDIIDNHMITTEVDDFPEEFSEFKEELEGRAMLVKKAEMVQAECIVRGYLEGSGLMEYQKTGSICGIKLPAGLKQCEKLPEPIFTPSTKAEEGHDESVTFEELSNKIGQELANKLRDTTIALYSKAANMLKARVLFLQTPSLNLAILMEILLLVMKCLPLIHQDFGTCKIINQEDLKKVLINNILENILKL